MFTKQEEKIARGLVADGELVALLTKALLTPNERLNSDIIQEKTNEELGEIVRAMDIAEMKIRARFNALLALGQPESKVTQGMTAPE